MTGLRHDRNHASFAVTRSQRLRLSGRQALAGSRDRGRDRSRRRIRTFKDGPLPDAREKTANLHTLVVTAQELHRQQDRGNAARSFCRPPAD
jgi:hypothetical protein